MPDFAFQIEGDASNADQAIEGVLGGLDSITAEAAQASRSITAGFNDAASRLNAVGASAAAVALKMRDALGGGSNGAAAAQVAARKAASEMADQLKRQEAILDAIHGPLENHRKDLAALSALYRMNKIDATEYQAQAQKLSATLARSQSTGVTKSAGPSPLAGIRDIATTAGIAVGVRELGELADGYTNIQNRLNLMTGDQARANVLFGELQNIARDSRSDLTATVDAYAGMSRATKQLGLTQDQTLRATKTLNELVTTSGRSASESAAGLMQFSQALSSGRLQGDELRSVFENMPTLVEALEKSLGVTQAELRKMGEEGKITSQVMVNALLQASSTADASIGKSMPTISQGITQFKNEVMVMVGEMNGATGISKIFGDTLSVAAKVIQTILAPVNLLGQALDAVGLSGSTAALAVAGMVVAGPVGAIAGVTVALLAEAGAFDSVTDVVERHLKIEEAFVSAQNRITLSLGLGKEALGKAYAAQVELNLALTLGADVAERFQRAFSGVKDEVKQFNASYNPTRLATPDSVAKSIYGERTDAVNKARIELDGLEIAYKRGWTTVDLYRQKKQQLLAIINGTVSAHGRETNELKRLAEALLGVESASERAIRAGAADRAANTNAISFLGKLDSDTSFTALKKYRAEVSQLLNSDADAELTGRGVDFYRKQYLDALGLRDAVFGARNASEQYAQALEKLQEAYTVGAVNAEEFSRAQRKLWDDAFKASEEARVAELTKNWEERIKEAQQANHDFAASFAPIGDAIRDAFMKGEASALSFDNAIRSVAFNLFKFMALQAAAHLTAGGGAGGIAGSILSGIFGAAHGAVIYEGHGGTDSQLVAIRKSPNERVTIETPEQYLGHEPGLSSGGGRGPVNFAIIPKLSERSITSAFAGAAGEQVLADYHVKFRERGR